MRIFSSRTAARNLGQVMDAARDGPVEIRKHGRRACVLVSLVSYADFEEYEALKFANANDEVLRALGEAIAAADAGEQDAADRIISRLPQLWRRGARR